MRAYVPIYANGKIGRKHGKIQFRKYLYKISYTRLVSE